MGRTLLMDIQTGTVPAAAVPVPGNSNGTGGGGYTWLNGSTYAAGGSAGGWSPSEDDYPTNGSAGTANTGNGGNGGSGTPNSWGRGGAGGSGVVIIRYPKGQLSATGGTTTESGGYVYHTFTSPGTFRIVSIGGGFLAFL